MYGAKMLEKCVKSQKTLWSKYLGSTNIMSDYSAILDFTWAMMLEVGTAFAMFLPNESSFGAL